MREHRETALHAFDRTLVGMDWSDASFPEKAAGEAVKLVEAWVQRGDEFARESIGIMEPSAVAVLEKLGYSAEVGQLIGTVLLEERETLARGL